MIGWRISVWKQEAGGGSPARMHAAKGARLASWQAGWRGLDWIDALASRGLAIRLGGDGYPTQYTARLEHLRAPVLEGPPEANDFWMIGEGDVLSGTPSASGPTSVDEEALRACGDGEWAIIEAWDES